MNLPRAVQRALVMVAAWSTVLAALPVLAGEMHVQGRIIDVVPIGSPHRSTTGAVSCEPQRPESRADLAALLAWDLRANCNGRHAARHVGDDGGSGYRVYYRWDGRTYQHVVSQPPVGDTISLRVRVN